MQDFPSYLLRHYFHTTDWHPSNSYLNLTSHSSSILLDFPIPNGLALSLSSSPTSAFFSTHRLRALPSLGGCAGYVIARTEKPLAFGGAGLREVLERFRIVHIPKRAARQSSSDKLDSPRDYLLYGCLHAPTARLDALYTTRISPAWNLIITACSFPPQSPFASNLTPMVSQDQQVSATSPSSSQQLPPPMSQGPTSPGATNLQFTLQHDAGKWFNEICYSLDDALWGFRTMHHFEPSTSGLSTSASQTRSLASLSEMSLDSSPSVPTTHSANLSATGPLSTLRPSHASTEVGGGLRGRFSAGAELFFSAAEKSAGLSTGVRFMTLPEGNDDGEGGVYGGIGSTAGDTGDARDWVSPSQPPTTITATLNPMMGHFSTAYASRLGRDIVACSRYDFNVYSYESDLTVGGEYWLRSAHASASSGAAAVALQSAASQDDPEERPIYWSAPSSGSQPLPRKPLSPAPSLRDNLGRTYTSSSQEHSKDSIPHSRYTSVQDPRAPGTAVGVDVQRTSGSKLQGAAASTEEFLERSSRLTPQSEAIKGPSQTGAGMLTGPTTGPSPDARASSTGDQEQSPSTPLASSSPSALLKFSLSSSMLLSLLWQGRLKNCLVSVGIKADLSASSVSSRGGPALINKKGNGGVAGVGMGSVVRTVGMEIVYWGGSAADASHGAGMDPTVVKGVVGDAAFGSAGRPIGPLNQGYASHEGID